MTQNNQAKKQNVENGPLDKVDPVARLALDRLAGKLIDKGIPASIIHAAAKETLAELAVETPAGQHEANVASLSELRKTKRRDFFGRAVLFHIENLFPPLDGEMKFKNGEQNGAIPREVAAGLIEAIKVSNDAKSLSEYEDFFMKKAERYRSKSRNGEVDVTSFANDGGVRSVARNMIKKFENYFNDKGEEGDPWLRQSIESRPSFQKIGRPLSDEEYQIIVDNIFKIK